MSGDSVGIERAVGSSPPPCGKPDRVQHHRRFEVGPDRATGCTKTMNFLATIWRRTLYTFLI